MNKQRVLTICICVLIFVGFLIFHFSRSHDHILTHKSSAKAVSEYVNEDVERYEKQVEIESKIKSALSPDTKDYLSDEPGIIFLLNEDLELSITGRVYLENALPSVADDLCRAVLATKDDYGISAFTVSVSYYQESNASGRDKETARSWKTNDGSTGTFVDNTGIYKMTLDELYAKYDDFGR